jgi:hypothetical protein
MIFIGSPVWAWSYTPAMATFFDESHLRQKKLALFCCHGGGMGGTLGNMSKRLVGNKILGSIDFVEPLRQDKEKLDEEVASWAKGMLNRAGTT